MRVEPRGPALARWNDFVGTAAADEPDAGSPIPSLYEVAGLDPTSWTILGVELTTVGHAMAVAILAFDRQAHGVSTYAGLLEYAEETGDLPATAFELTTPSGTEIFSHLAVSLTARGLRDKRLTVIDRRPLATPRRLVPHLVSTSSPTPIERTSS